MFAEGIDFRTESFITILPLVDQSSSGLATRNIFIP